MLKNHPDGKKKKKHSCLIPLPPLYCFKTSCPDVGKVFCISKKKFYLCNNTGETNCRYRDKALLGKQPQPLSPTLHQHQILITQSKYMNSCSWTRVKDAHHMPPSWNEAFAALVAGLMTMIAHTTSFQCLVACLATHTWDLEEGEAIVFNHLQGEICFQNQVLGINGSRRQAKRFLSGIILLTSLSGTSDTFFMVGWDKRLHQDKKKSGSYSWKIKQEMWFISKTYTHSDSVSSIHW